MTFWKKIFGGAEERAEKFYYAAGNGDLSTVKELLRRDRRLVSVRPFFGDETPLHNAAEEGHLEVVRLLLAHGADANAKDHKGNTPFDLAIRSFRGAEATELLRQYTKPDPSKMICQAAFEGKLDDMQQLLRENPKLVFSKDGEGRTALHLAALQGQREAVELLLSKNAAVAARDNVGWTPLHCAARRGHQRIVELLIAHGANVRDKSNAGGTPLHVCDYVSIAEILLANGADVNARDKEWWTPLRMAQHENVKPMIDFLQKHGGQT
jgi:uncharacterized protein